MVGDGEIFVPVEVVLSMEVMFAAAEVLLALKSPYLTFNVKLQKLRQPNIRRAQRMIIVMPIVVAIAMPHNLRTRKNIR